MIMAQCETSDFSQQNSVNTNYVLESLAQITSTTFSVTSTADTMTPASSFVDKSTSSFSPTDSTNNSSVNIPQAANKPKLGTYLIDRTIGKGIFSVVKLATHTITGINLAIKIIDKTRLDAENLTKIYRESEILKKLHHPNIVKLFQVMETPRLLYIAMEFLPNGEVFDYIANHGRFPEPEARVKFLDVLHAVDHIHSMGIVHRDIKAENLLFDAHMNIKLTDFSFGTHYSSSASQPLLTTWCGSPPYAAPEIFKGEPYVGTKADIWSLGVVLYVMVCGTLPFDAQPLPYLKNQVLSASFRIPYWLSLTCERLIRSMLSKCPVKRPSTQEIKQHPWLTSVPVAAVHRQCVRSTTTHPVHQSLPQQLYPHPRQYQHSSAHRASVGDQPHGGPRLPGFSTDSLDVSVDQGLSNSPDQAYERSSSTIVPQTTTNEPGIHSSTPEGAAGSPNEFVLLIMESLGMKRSQILESLERHAYDHLMATYLLLGEKLRRHRHHLPFGLPIQSTVGSPQTMCELDALSVGNQPTMTMEIGHPKHSRVDSAVDVKCSSSESEFRATVALSTSVSDIEQPNSCGVENRWNPVDNHHRLRPPSPQFTSPLSQNPDAALLASSRRPIRPAPNTRFPSYSDSNNPITCFYPPHLTQPHRSLAPDKPVKNQEVPLFSSISPNQFGPSVFSTSPTDSLALSATTTNNTFGSLHSDIDSPHPVLTTDFQTGVASIQLQSMMTDRDSVSGAQTNLPWLIHDERAAPPVHRRTLARRKYVVFTPPDHLDQLVQAVMAEKSIDETKPARADVSGD
ncbi:Serine/threonine-protein kinase SIK2 [Fasciola hepatica]|uniref:non-specific serine/threonine protein kinase n=1 Tax=Fasciola hepatica TaxID=6192 RepID=A0A4E0RCA0_FASHE|nr:Serine/threonine-protein kinase SIK2 [Fasciola hepatica]